MRSAPSWEDATWTPSCSSSSSSDGATEVSSDHLWNILTSADKTFACLASRGGCELWDLYFCLLMTCSVPPSINLGRDWKIKDNNHPLSSAVDILNETHLVYKQPASGNVRHLVRNIPLMIKYCHHKSYPDVAFSLSACELPTCGERQRGEQLHWWIQPCQLDKVPSLVRQLAFQEYLRVITGHDQWQNMS